MLKMSDQIDQLASALALFQTKLENAKFDSNNPAFRSKYASITAVLEAAFPLLGNCGLSISCDQTTDEKDREFLTTTLMHKSGQYKQSSARLLVEKATPQGKMSAVTYARRMSISCILGISADDDDGNEAEKNAPHPPKPQHKPQHLEAKPYHKAAEKINADMVSVLEKELEGHPAIKAAYLAYAKIDRLEDLTTDLYNKHLEIIRNRKSASAIKPEDS